MERSWKNTKGRRDDITNEEYSGIENFSLFMESDAQNEPVDTNTHVKTNARLRIEPWLSPFDVSPDAVRSRIATALNAIENMDQMDGEEAYIAKLSELRSEEQQGVFATSACCRSSASCSTATSRRSIVLYYQEMPPR
eukprot:2729135-Prymnesium_polylepis.1